MHREVTIWAKACPRCHAAKITRHNTAPPIMLPPASEKFGDNHHDVVGPLPEVKWMQYFLTVVDRFSRWTMAEPMANDLVSTTAYTFIRGWIQHHGVPHSTTTDRGTNFQSSQFQALIYSSTRMLPHSHNLIPSATQWHGGKVESAP